MIMGKKRKIRSFSSRLTGWIMLMMLITMGIISYVIFEGASTMTKEEEFSRYEAYLDSKVAEIRRALSDVYVGTVNHVPEIEQNLGNPDRLSEIMRQVVALNPRINSCGLSFVANYYPQKGRWFSPFASRSDSSKIEVTSLGSADNDYLSAKWFEEALEAKEGFWSKPFFEGNDTTKPRVAYLCPIRDRSGRTVAVLGADISLEWLRLKMLESDRGIMKRGGLGSPSGPNDTNLRSKKRWEVYSFLIDCDGTYLVHPEQERILQKNIFDYTKNDPDSLSTNLVREMVAGEKDLIAKSEKREDPDLDVEEYTSIVFDGRSSYMFYAPIKYTDWSLGLSVPALGINLIGAIVGGLLLFLIAIGLLVVFLVCHFTIRRITKPLKQLAASADEVAKGNFSTPLPTVKHNDEICLLRNSFDDMQHSLVKYVEEMKSTTASKAAIENELQVAHNIQMGMLPKVFPPYPDRDDIDIFGMLSPAREVGGDLFDFYIRDNHLFFCIGDVSGKGVPASLFMAVTRSLFRNISAHTSDPGQIITALNEALVDGNDSCMFVTLFVGVIDLESGRIRYSNAGHDQPLLIGRDISLLPCDANVPLGVMSEWTFTVQESVVDPGTTIFLYTDGITEAENIRYDQFGIQRVEETARLMQAEGISKPHDIVKRMAEAVHAFVGEAHQSDDLTMLAIKYMKTQ